MKVLCVGFWKTGTKSLSKALSLLGYNVFDYEEQIVDLMDTWKKFFNGTITDEEIYAAFKDVDVLIDGPVIVFWEEIYRVFPNSKIIFTSRDEDSWWKSWKNMNDQTPPLLRIALMVSLSANSFIAAANHIFNLAFGIENFHRFKIGWNANERLYKMMYRKHNCYVLHTVPADKRLVHKSAHGWDSICKYLEHDIPIVPYPHENKNGSLFQDQMTKSPLFRQIVFELKIFSGVVLLGVAAFFGWCFL